MPNQVDIDKVLNGSGNYAVLVLNQPIQVHPELFTNIWNKAHLRITVDGGSNRWLNFVETHKLNLDLPSLITGDFDSIKPTTKQYFEDRHVKFVPTPDQDFTDFTKAARKAKEYFDEHNIPLDHIITIVEHAGRLDQTMANIETLFHLIDINVLLLASDSLTWLLAPGDHVIQVHPQYIKDKYWCGLIPLSGTTRVTTTGLQWDLTDTNMEFGVLVSTSNTYAKDTVTVSTDKKMVWTMQIAAEKP